MTLRSTIKIILILVMMKKAWSCKTKVSPKIQERFNWYDGEIWKLEAQVMELKAELDDQRQIDLPDDEAYVEEYNE